MRSEVCLFGYECIVSVERVSFCVRIPKPRGFVVGEFRFDFASLVDFIFWLDPGGLREQPAGEAFG